MQDVIVAGAGVIGCSIGYALARGGRRVTILDRNGEVGHGTTSASCAIVRRFYSTFTMTAMAQEGALTWADWAAHLDATPGEQLARFERPGMIFIPTAVDDSLHETMEHMRRAGVEVELLSPARFQERFPYLDLASHSPVKDPEDEDFFQPSGRQLEGVVFEPDAGYVVSPTLATQNLRDAALRSGATFKLNSPVTAIESGDNGPRFQLTLESGEVLRADVLVNATGPHSSLFNAMVGVELPLETRPLRREVCAVDNPLFSASGGASVPVIGDVDSGVYSRPEGGSAQLTIGSLDPPLDTLEWQQDPDACDPNISRDTHRRQVMRMMKRFDAIQLGPPSGIASMYDVTVADWNPILDRTDRDGYYVAIGTSGSSFKTAPIIGHVMERLIDACEGGLDHDHQPLGLALPRSELEISVGFFSRNRHAHAGSGTVLA